MEGMDDIGESETHEGLYRHFPATDLFPGVGITDTLAARGVVKEWSDVPTTRVIDEEEVKSMDFNPPYFYVGLFDEQLAREAIRRFTGRRFIVPIKFGSVNGLIYFERWTMGHDNIDWEAPTFEDLPIADYTFNNNTFHTSF